MPLPFALPALGALGPLAGRWWKLGVGAIIGAALAFPLGQCSGARHEKDRQAAANAIAVAAALKTDSAAKEKAAGERMADAQSIAAKQEELTNAVADLSDETPSVRDVELACARLRQQGTDVTDVPACGGPRGAAQTPAQPGRP